MADEDANGELAQLREERRQLTGLLDLIQELMTTVVRSESVGDLFARAFRTLVRCVPFDAGAAVMLEQNLDFYLSTRAGAGSLVNENLVARIRQSLQTLIPVSFEDTEVVVKGERHELPRGEAMGMDHDAYALLEHDGRPAGFLFLTRGGDAPFSTNEAQILKIFATQVAVLLDIIRARERIINLAETDDLTGVWNRRYFRRQMPQEIERARTFGVPLSLLMFDIDDFKQINDSFGHLIGDVVLSELCGAVRDTVRPTDPIARVGGDEFAVILPHTDRAGAIAVAERILQCVRALAIPADEESVIQCSVSVGVAEFEGDEAGDDLFRRADERLYSSKRQGKNRYTA